MKVKPAKEIIEFLQPIVKTFGAELVDAEWNFRDNSLNLTIDAETGVDLDLLEKVHRAVDEPLDEFDPTFGSPYTLNCSSPGLDRPFKTERDFTKNTGEKIEVHFFAPFEGKKYYEGTLTDYDGKTIAVVTDAGEKRFPIEKTSKICLLIEV